MDILGTPNNDTLTGTADNDAIAGQAGNDQLHGLAGNDTLEGGTGSDTLDGGTGDDTLNPGLGRDQVDGGEGTDTLVVDYSANQNTGPYSAGISSSQYYRYYVAYKGDAGDADAVNYSNVEQFDITGTQYNDQIETGSGDDTIRSGAGDDALTPGGGNDVIDGGAGIDTLTQANFATQTQDLTIDNSGATITLEGGGMVSNVERFNTLSTGAGNDTINFTVVNNETISGGAGNDRINSGLGRDIVDGGEGTDTLVVDYSANQNTGPYSAGIQSSQYFRYYSAHKGSGGDVDSVDYRNMERFDITGTQYNDQIETGSGDDTIRSGAGDDTLTPGGGNDVIDGGAGIDTLTQANFANQTQDLTIDHSGATITLEGGGQVNNVERFNNLTTGSGNDTIHFTVVNNETISGGAGNDRINPGLGRDQVDGGEGTDTLVVDYSANQNTYSAGISSSQYWRYYLASKGDAGDVDSVNYSNVERFDITGTQYNDQIETGSGDDTIRSGAGDDTLTPGGGNDVIDGGAGIDTLTQANFANQTQDLTIDHSGTTITLEGGGQVSNVERFNNLTTGSGNDTIHFTVVNNETISGGAGNDRINPGLGRDQVDGGEGTDTLVVDYSANEYTGTNPAGIQSSQYWRYYSAYKGDAGDVDSVNYYNVERFDITGTQYNDQIETGSGDDTIRSGAGDDLLTPGSGNDVIDGGAGIDTITTANFSNQTQNLTIDHSGATIDLEGGGQVSNVERFNNLTTGSGNDTINFTAVNNETISGGEGNDRINPGLGRDQVDGGDGTDTLVVDYSANEYTGTQRAGIQSSQYWRYYSAYKGDAGEVDSVNYYNVERFDITGTQYNDQIETGSGDDTLRGGAGNDSLVGNAGNDILTGVNAVSAAPGVGEIDTLVGGAGSDLFALGDGRRVFYDDRDSTTTGINDYARIVDFNPSEDVIQLKGEPSHYRLGSSPISAIPGTAIFSAKSGTEPDELIGIVEGVSDLNLETHFSYTSIAPGSFAFSAANFNLNEDGTLVTPVTVVRTGGTDGAVSVTIELSNGTATAPADYDNTPIVVHFAAGETVKTVPMPIVNDRMMESSETLILTLTNPTGDATLGAQTTAVVTIADDDDAQLNFSTANYWVQENGTAVTHILVTRSGRATGAVSATVTFTDGTAKGCTCAASSVNNDFYNGSFVLTLADGEMSKAIPVELANAGGKDSLRIRDDVKVEGDEYFTIALTNPSENVRIGAQGTAKVTILDDDVELSFSAPTFSVKEDGQAIAAVTVIRAGQTQKAVGATLNLSGGTATYTDDYSQAAIAVTLEEGVTSQVVQIPVKNDLQVEPDETVNLTLSNPRGGATIGAQNTATLTIVDNGGAPALVVSLAQDLMAENGGTVAIGTVTRHPVTDQELVVTLTSSDTTEATVPAQVIIPANQATVTFPLTAIADDQADGIQNVTITASATGFTSGTSAIAISDINVPDLVVTKLTAQAPLLSGKPASLTYRVENRGLAPAVPTTANTPIVDRLYLSKSASLDSTAILLSEPSITAEIPAGQFYERTIPFTAPKLPGAYYLIAIADATHVVNEGGALGDGNNQVVTPIAIAPAYRAVVATETEVSLAGNPVILRGQAISNADDSPVPYEFVTIAIKNNGFVRELSAFTDAQGNFVKAFQPLPGEGGSYAVSAYFPNFPGEDPTAEDQFKVLGMRFETAGVAHKVIAEQPFTAQVGLQNLADVELTGLTTQLAGVPSDWTVQVQVPATLPATLPASLPTAALQPLRYTIAAPNTSPITQATVQLTLTSAEGVTATLPISISLERITPRLVASTALLTSGMVRDRQTVVEFAVTNQGGAAAENIQIQLPDAPWLKLASPATIAALAPGESTKVTLILAPAANLALTEYQGNIILESTSNEGGLSLPFKFRATSEAVGSLRINVVDELTYFAEGAPKLANATVILRDYFTGNEIRQAVTDQTGTVAWDGLAEGHYKLEAKAENHSSFEQIIQLNPGEIKTIDSFLSKQTVKYVWRVQKTEIEDRTRIVIQSVFETDVPIPTITIDPPSIDLADLNVVGQVIRLDMTVTNHGLIAANNIQFIFGEHPFYKIEPLVQDVSLLGAKSSITIPVQITRTADFDTLANSFMERASMRRDTPPVPCNISAGLFYGYVCGPQTVEKNTKLAVINVRGNCSPTTSPTIPIIPIEPINPTRRNPLNPVNPVNPIPVIIESPTDCCLEIELFKKDFSSIFKPFLETAELAINRYLSVETGKLAEIDLDVKAEATVKTCCPFEMAYYAQATGTGRLIVGANPPPQDFNIKAPETLLKDSIFRSVSLSGEGFIDISVQPYIQIEGFVGKKCKKDFDYSLGITVGLDLNAGMQGELTATAEFIDDDNPKTESVKAEGGLFGNLSYNLTVSSKDGLSTCFSSDGLYLSAYVSAFGYTLSPFDKPITEEVEVKKYLLDPVSCGSPTSLLAASLYELHTVPSFSDELEAQIARLLNLEQLHADLNFDRNSRANQLMPESKTGSVCARVKLQLDQDAIMTRSAFLGSLEIDNGSNGNLEKISINLQVKDAQDNIVNDLFGITKPTLKNITAVDGTGILTSNNAATPENEGVGSAQWTFIPTNLAAPDVPTQYSIGGTLSYTENGQGITVPLLSTPITVYPQAELHLDYFQERNVYADDPFTDPIEGSVPFCLGVIVRNAGKGDAKNLQITSGQPKIVENEKGLLIDFQIIGSEVNGDSVSPSLAVNFGNIAAGKTAVATWLFKSSLQGKFIDYQASFQHINDLGKPELSLIKSTTIHELVRKVRVSTPTDDGLPDFLVNDTPDRDFYPDTLYFSNGDKAAVTVVTTATADHPASLTALQVTITATTEAGWIYLRLTDPANGQFQIKRVLRADGSELRLENVWISDRTFPAKGRPIYENILHLLDHIATPGSQTYTIIYTTGDQTPPRVEEIVDVAPNPRNTPVASLEVRFTKPIRPDSFDYQDLTLTLNNGPNRITPAVTLTPLNPTTYRIDNLASLTGALGQYQLTIHTTGVQDVEGLFGSGSMHETWIFTGDRPAIAAIAGLAAPLRNTPVEALEVSFTQAIQPSSFNLNALHLSRDGISNLIGDRDPNPVSITSINQQTYRISNLGSLTAIAGTYHLRVDASRVTDTNGNSGIGTQTLSWTLDPNPPRITTITPVTSPRNKPVSSLDIDFSKPINPATLNLSDLSLTVDGNSNLLTNSVSLTPLSETRYRLSGLAALQTRDGTYTLAIADSHIQDLAGNTLTNPLSVSWMLDTRPPAPPTEVQVNRKSIRPADPVRLNSTTVEIAGSLAESGLSVYLWDRTLNQPLGQATTTGTTFSGTVQLPGPGARDLDIQLVDAAGNRTVTSLALFVDLTPPTLLEFPNLPQAPVLVPITSLDVRFSEAIDLASFTVNSLTLSRDGSENLITPAITIAHVSGTTYQIQNLTTLTNTSGTYTLTVNTTGIQDLAGNFGTETQRVSFSVEAIPTPGAIAFSAAQFRVREDGTPANPVTLIRTDGSDGTVSVTLILTNGTAIAPSDYTDTPIIVTFAPGETHKTLQIPILNDSLMEANKTILLTLQDPTNGATLGSQTTATLTILDSDRAFIPWRNYQTGETVLWHLDGLNYQSLTLLPPVPDPNWTIQHFADFDQDGDADILWQHRLTGQTVIWEMQGASALTFTQLPKVEDPNWNLEAVADLNRDGNLDLLWRHRVTGQNLVWVMNGLSYSTAVSLPTVEDLNWSLEAVADFSQDGNLDLLWRHQVTGQNVVWAMNGLNYSTFVFLPTVEDPNWKIEGVADFNQDGNLDLLWRHQVTGENVVWAMNGLNYSTFVFLPTVKDPNWSIEQATDFDGDGSPDILWRHRVTGQTLIWKMNGMSYSTFTMLPTVADPNWKIEDNSAFI